LGAANEKSAAMKEADCERMRAQRQPRACKKTTGAALAHCGFAL
jgi:hypothetical protein